MMRARFPLLLLLGIVFLASVSVSFAVGQKQKCLSICDEEKNLYQKQVCQISCSLIREHDEDEEQHPRPQPGRQDEEQDERQQPRHQREREDESEQEDEDSESESQKQNNPFHFRSNRFHTLYKNQHGQIRLLQRFDQRSQQLQNLRDYRILEFRSKPNTLLLPHHDDAEFLLVVLSGKAIITFVNPDERDSYKLERGDAVRIPAGTTFYLVNPQDNDNLRIIKLALPVNNPRRLQSFFLSSTKEQQSYMEAFGENVLEASLNTGIEEINRVLFGEENRGEKSQSEELEGVIVEISKEQIRELSRQAKSSSRKTISSEDEPFNLRDRKPLYSNKFGKLFEITPEKNPQLRDLDIFLSYLDINEGGLFLPHYNSKSTVLLVVEKGEANIELVGLRQQQQQQQRQQEEQEGPREVRRYRAELSEDDIFVIPAAYPFVVNATSDLRLFAFGINAENNQRNFLAGEKDNVLRQLHRQVKGLAFPGSAEDVENLIQNQRESYFVDAQPQQEHEGRKGRKGPLSSILGALH